MSPIPTDGPSSTSGIGGSAASTMRSRHSIARAERGVRLMAASTNGRRGVVFDLDGVLVMSEHLWETAWVRYATAHGRAWTADDTRKCQGMSVAEWSAYLAERSSGD